MSGQATSDDARFRIVEPIDDLGPTPWSDPSWRTSFLAWIDETLAMESIESHGTLDVRLRAWSIVGRIPLADGGQIWAKANPPGAAFEAELSEALSTWAPGYVLTPVAIDAANGWFLLPDGGATHERPVPDDPPGAHFRQPYRRFADLQRLVSPHVDELRDMGVPDFRPGALPVILDGLLDRVPLPEVDAKRGQIAEWCAELAESTIAPSLDNGDLHEHQMFRDAAGGEDWRFFDWGTAAIAHPFASLLYPHGYYFAHPDSIESIDTAYLESWPGDPTTLRRTADLATRLAKIGLATLRDRNFPGASDQASVDDHIRSILRWLAAD